MENPQTFPGSPPRVINLSDPWVDSATDGYVKKLQEIAERSTRELAIAEERAEVTRRLHELAGRTLHRIALKAGELINSALKAEVRDELSIIRNEAAQGVVEVRHAGYELSFLDLKSKGFVGSVRALATRFERETGIPTGVKVKGEVEVSREIQVALFRVIHEALVNVERNARASAVVVSIKALEDQINMTIRDDGVGLDQRQGPDWLSAAHFGIRLMAKSVKEVGGTFRVRAVQPRGLEICVKTPTTSS